MSGARAAAAIERFLFTAVNPGPLALLRVVCALLVILVFHPVGRFIPSPQFEGVFADHPGLAQFVDAPSWLAAVVMCTGLMAVGLVPRFASGLLVVLLLPALAQFGRYPGRVLVWNVVLCFAFLRSDAAFSIRRLVRDDAIPASPLWPIRIMQLSLSLLYAANVVSKLYPAFLSGHVLSLMSMEMNNFHVLIADVVPLPFGLSIPASVAATGTVLIESVLAIGWWLPGKRWMVAALGCAFHLALKFVVTIGWLDWVAISLYLVFLLPLAGVQSASRSRPSGATSRPRMRALRR